MKEDQSTLDKSRLLEAQVAVIGSILIDPEIVGEAVAMINPNDFTSAVYRRIYDAVTKVYFSRKPVDAVMVANELPPEYQRTLLEVMQVTPTAANWKPYAELMHEQSGVQRIQNLAAELIYTPSMEDATQIMDKLNEQFCGRHESRVVTFAQGLADFYTRHDGAKPPDYLKWGFSALDASLCAESGDFIIIGGYPSAGKTVLAIEFGWKMASDCNKRVGMFSLETKDKKLYDRLICRVSGVPFDEIKHNKISSESWKGIAEITSFTDTVSLDVINASGMTVNEIRALALAHHYDVIFIDYLQLIKTSGKYRESRVEAVTEISMALHTFSQDTGITVIALSQLSRQDKAEKSKAPTMSSLRESGQLEQDADIIMLLYLIDESQPNGDRRLKIAKNKEGERGYLQLGFEPQRMMLFPRSSRSDEPPQKSRFTELKKTNVQEVMEVFGGGDK